MAYTKVEIGYFVGSYDTIGVKTKVKKKKYKWGYSSAFLYTTNNENFLLTEFR